MFDDGNELDIGVAERDDPVRCTPPRVSPALHGGEAVPSFDDRPRGGEVVDRYQDVIDRERHRLTLSRRRQLVGLRLGRRPAGALQGRG